VDLPIWNWNASGIDEARSQLAVAQREQALVERDIDAQVTGRHGACAAAVALASTYRDRLLPAAVRNMAATNTSYRLGEIGLLDVIDSRRVLTATQKDSIAALARAHAECQQLTLLSTTEGTR